MSVIVKGSMCSVVAGNWLPKIVGSVRILRAVVLLGIVAVARQISVCK